MRVYGCPDLGPREAAGGALRTGGGAFSWVRQNGGMCEGW